MCFRKAVASNVAWRMTKILESIDQPMSGIGSKPSWMAEAAQSLFETSIRTKDRSRPSRMLKKSASGVLASLRGSAYRSVRLASSLAAALLDDLFEHPVRNNVLSRDLQEDGCSLRF